MGPIYYLNLAWHLDWEVWWSSKTDNAKRGLVTQFGLTGVLDILFYCRFWSRPHLGPNKHYNPRELKIKKICIVGSKLKGPVVWKDWFLYGKNRKMPISIRYEKFTKCLSQLGMEKDEKIRHCRALILKNLDWLKISKNVKSTIKLKKYFFWVEWKI